MQKKIAMNFLITGKVQGVWFRAGTQDEAKRLGITGWARNLPDGRVEVIACGDAEKILELHEWLKHGPELAEVKNVDAKEIAWQEHERFAVK